MGTGAAIAAILPSALLVIGLCWYLKRAKRVSGSNDARNSFQRNLLLDLQDIRDEADEELAKALDELIDMARYDTTASNGSTAELDDRISAAVQELATAPTVEGAERLKDMLSSRNRRAKR